jgi:predicted acetyltransferase
MENEVVRFNREWMGSGEEIVPSSVSLTGRNFEAWLLETYLMEKVAPKGYVTAHTYLFVDGEDRMLGAINIRHNLNGYLYNYGGHIGYGIRPSERMKGYGVKMLAMALPLAKEIGLEKVLITCHKENTPSRRIILRNGGVMENEVTKDGRTIERYWIAL